MKLSRLVIVLGAVLLAVAVNLVIFVVAGYAGASLRFPAADGPDIHWLFVVVLSAVPLAIALVAVALLAPRWPWMFRAALVAAPVLAVVSIPLMPLPVGFDLGTTVALSLMHLVVGAIGVGAVLALRRDAAGA